MKLLLLLLLLVPVIVHSQIKNEGKKDISYTLKEQKLNIKSKYRISNITVRNSDFRKTYAPNHERYIIDVSEYPKGHYVAIVVTNKKVITFNFSK